MTKESTAPHTVHWIVKFGKLRMAVKVALLLGAAALAGLSTACRSSDDVVLESPHSFSASADDSLKTPLAANATAVLSRGATLAVGKETVNPMGAPGFRAILSGAARLTVATGSVIEVHATPGHVNLTHGTYELTASPASLVVHTIDGEDALLYKPSGFFSVVPRKVPVDDVGIVERAHWAPRVSKQHAKQ